jgi:hypothetical protein
LMSFHHVCDIYKGFSYEKQTQSCLQDEDQKAEANLHSGL